MILLKKITRAYNWPNSLGHKKNQKGKCQRGKKMGFCKGTFLLWPACLGSFNEPPHLGGKLAPALFYVSP